MSGTTNTCWFSGVRPGNSVKACFRTGPERARSNSAHLRHRKHCSDRGWLTAIMFACISLQAGCQSSEGTAQPGCKNLPLDLSIVIPARNDGHGGDFLNRLKNTLMLASRFAWEEMEVGAEIIVIVWSDPQDAVPVHEALGLGRCTARQACTADGREGEEYWHDNNVVIRFLTVPPERHAEVYNPLRLGLLQYVAKNVGVRRACGRHVLITNADCLLPWTMLNHIVTIIKQSDDVENSRKTSVASVRDTPFLLASRHDLLRPIANVEGELALQTHVGPSGISLRELTGEACRHRGFNDVFAETRRFSSLLNIGDFLLVPWHALNATLGYSEHHLPFGLDGELVCRLALKHKMQPRLLFPPCVVFHQPHPHAYNFSHPPFPWQRVCQEYQEGKGTKDEQGGEADEEPEHRVTRQWGYAHWQLTEHVLFPSGRMLTDTPAVV